MRSRPAEFGSFFEFVRNGMNIKQDKSGDGIPITRIETISAGEVDSSRVGYAGVKASEAEKWLLEPGDILFSHINSVEHIGKCALYDGSPTPLIHGMNLLNLRPKKNTLDPNYGKWLLRSSTFRTKLMPFVNKAVNQASVSIGNLSSIKVHVPVLEEQKRIAAILDQADSLRRLRQRAIDRLNTLGQAIFYEMFGECFQEQRSCDLSDVMTIKKSLVDPKAEPFSSLPHVSPEHIDAGSGRISWGEVRSAAEDGIISGKYEFSAGTVLYSKIRPYLNKVALPDRKGLCSADMYVLACIAHSDGGFGWGARFVGSHRSTRQRHGDAG